MRRVLTTTAAATALLLATAAAAPGHAGASAGAGQPVDLAIIGDIPYGPARIAAFPADIAQINTDPTVSQVVHLGDIKNGSSRCDTSYFEQIRADFDQFEDPLIYTPGDNEWTDCHRASNGGYQPAGRQIDGAPIVTPGPSRLDEVRRIFFDRPGRTPRARPAARRRPGRALRGERRLVRSAGAVRRAQRPGLQQRPAAVVRRRRDPPARAAPAA